MDVDLDLSMTQYLKQGLMVIEVRSVDLIPSYVGHRCGAVRGMQLRTIFWGW